MAIARRQHGKVYEGHTLPYGTLADASQELRQAYYYNGYLHDKDMPELPCVPIDGEYVDPEEELSKKEMVDVIGEMLDTLAPRLKKVLCLRYGIGLAQDYTLEEVGTRFDVTRERIRQIEAKALRLMKHPSRSDKLRELLGLYESTAEKEAQEQAAKARWEKERAKAEERRQAEMEARIARAQEIKRMQEEDRGLRNKWEEIKPMVSDTDWVAHLKTTNPAMYQELKYMVGDIWGKNANQVWDMYAEKK